MIGSIILSVLVFGYAGYTLYRHARKSKEGACSGCSQNKSCSMSCCPPEMDNSKKPV